MSTRLSIFLLKIQVQMQARGDSFASGRRRSTVPCCLFWRLAVKMLGFRPASIVCTVHSTRQTAAAPSSRYIYRLTEKTSRHERLETCLARVRHAALILVIHISD